MGRTRPLLQQIIMGVKINLAKWSDALLETSNCFSLILLPPPHSLRAANDAAVGAGVSPGEEGLGGCPPGASARQGPALPSGLASPEAPTLPPGRPPSPGAPPLPSAAPGTRPHSCITLSPVRPGGTAGREEGGPFSLHPKPLHCLFSAGELRLLTPQAQRHTGVVKEADPGHRKI